MAKTSTERMREKKERDERARKALEDSTYPLLKTPLGEWLEGDSFASDFDLPLELAGFQPPDFADERDPKEFVINDATDLDDPFPGAQGAVGRAEVIMDCLLDAAQALADALNRYKREEIEARLTELENSEGTDRAAAIKEAVRLNRILDRLNKQVRRSFPEWKVTGV